MLTHDNWTITDAWRGTPIAAELDSLDAVFALDGELVAEDKENRVLRIRRGDQVFYVKQVAASNRFRDKIGLSRIRREARNQLWFNDQGIPSAPVVGYGTTQTLTHTRRGAIVLEGVANSCNLGELAEQAPALLADRAWRARVREQLATIVRELHSRHFYHNDLFWRNVLVTKDAANPRVYLIDCPMGRITPGPLRSARQVKDFFCLGRGATGVLSRTEQLRFYLSYCQRDQLSEADKRFLRRLAARQEKGRQKREARRQRKAAGG